jgi:hypothetical protein
MMILVGMSVLIFARACYSVFLVFFQYPKLVMTIPKITVDYGISPIKPTCIASYPT